ncbi:hypothetical protein FHR70_002184 [Microvirga lupini]|uniref:Uncharacterized protein n=1 Tax=Microvirga lupini TaxID=420324 RepID=A0A7W4YW63_9HYPH|nr:hypothetical protein [Microvirga lupini]
MDVLRLSFSHHMNHLNAVQDHASARRGPEAQHRANPTLDRAVILLNAIIEILTLPDADRLELLTCPVLKPVCRITGQDCLTVHLAAVDHDPLGPAVAFQCLAQKALCGREIASFAEPEFDGVAVAVDGAIDIPPLPSDLDVRFVDVPPADDRALTPIELL